MARAPKPRLALGARRKLRAPGKHLAALDAWVEKFRGQYPAGSTRPVESWHLPVDERLVSPPWAEVAHQAHALKALLQAAAFLHAAKPPCRSGEKIYIITHWPKMFMAEVGVFLDPAYAATFETRTSPTQTWSPLPKERDLARDLGIAVPSPFLQRGYHEVSRDEPEAPAFETEVWIWREPLPSARS